jgi:hypothetical protein
MRKIYFILFGLVLAVLILLVDWREKFDTIIKRQPAVPTPLGQLLPPQPDLTLLDSLGGMLPEEWAAGELDAASAAGEFSGLGLESGDPVFGLTRPRLPGLSGTPAAAAISPPLPAPPPARNPAKSLQARPSFQDAPQQPYLDESRQLLRQAVRNYERISPTAPATPGQDRQP